MATTVLQHEKVWLDKFKYDDAERQYYESLSKVSHVKSAGGKSKKASCAEGKKACSAQQVSAGGGPPMVVYENVWFDKYKYDDAERSYFESLAKPVTNGVPSLAQPKPNPKHSAQSAKNPPPASKPVPAAAASGVPVNNPVSVPVCKVKCPGSAAVNPEPNLKTKIVIADAADTNNENATAVANNNKNKEKRFKVKEKTRQKKKEEREKNAINNQVSSNNPIMRNTLADEVAKARQHIQNSLECMDGIAALTTSNKEAELLKRIGNLENTNKNLQNDVTQLKETVAKLTMLINDLQKKCAAPGAPSSGGAAAPKPAPAAAKKADDDDDDGVDLFGSDSEEEDEEAKKIKEKRLAEYASRKSKKPVLIAKSNIILDVKPWDDETNMQELEAEVRKVSCDGLIWGASKLVPLAYGIHKLQISCVVEDDKVSVDWLQETIQEIEDYVQSVDIAAFNKV